MQHIGAMLGHQINDRSTGTKKYKVLFGTHDECKNIEIGKKIEILHECNYKSEY
jgi:carbamoylphosphate synthase small subunit